MRWHCGQAYGQDLRERVLTAIELTVGRGAAARADWRTAWTILRRHISRDPHRHEHRHWLWRQHALAHLTPPVPQQAAAHLVPARHGVERRPRPLDFGHDPHFLLTPPATPPLSPGDDLHPKPPPISTAPIRASLRSPSQVRQSRRYRPDRYGARARRPAWLHRIIGSPLRRNSAVVLHLSWVRAAPAHLWTKSKARYVEYVGSGCRTSHPACCLRQRGNLD